MMAGAAGATNQRLTHTTPHLRWGPLGFVMCSLQHMYTTTAHTTTDHAYGPGYLCSPGRPHFTSLNLA
jgi:hypothetical protein